MHGLISYNKTRNDFEGSKGFGPGKVSSYVRIRHFKPIEKETVL